jgi:hypothetical protein
MSRKTGPSVALHAAGLRSPKPRDSSIDAGGEVSGVWIRCTVKSYDRKRETYAVQWEDRAGPGASSRSLDHLPRLFVCFAVN